MRMYELHADKLPEDEHHHEVVGEHDAEHGKEEKRQPAKIAPVAFLVGHVAERINENQRRNRVDHHEHGPAQWVNGHADGNGKDVRDVDPEELIRADFARLEEKPPTQCAGKQCRADGQSGAQISSKTCRRGG